MFGRLIFALLGLTVLAPLSPGQMRGGGVVRPPHFTPGFAGPSFGGHFHRGGLGPGFVYLGDPFLYDAYAATPIVYPPPAPQVIVIQPASNTEASAEKRIDPLLIELQGDQYVRFEGGRAQLAPDRASATPSGFVASAQASPHSPISGQSQAAVRPPAVLVYRDGHREEVVNYAIVGGVIYARGNYWEDGYWTKDIQLASLDIPATMKANQASGVNFVLPSGPNVVVTRP